MQTFCDIMVHRCPHCSKEIAIKLKTELLTPQQMLDDYEENNNKEKENDGKTEKLNTGI